MGKVGIVGYGYVGKAMHLIFPDALVYDTDHADRKEMKKRINTECDLAIICVPTPMMKNGRADISAVKESVSWLLTPYILIKSAVPPGTVREFTTSTRKKIGVSPEYIGEGGYHITPWKYMSPTDPRLHDFLIIGADDPKVAEAICNFFVPRLGPEKTYYLCTSVEAEIIKYMENSWIALKVIFANEFYRLCESMDASYIKVREGWALDNRVDKMHTAVFVDKQGFGGKCLPKDINAIVKRAEDYGVKMHLLKAIIDANDCIQDAESEEKADKLKAADAKK